MSTQAESVTQSDVDRLPLDIERIHELAEALLPVSEQIDADLPVEDRKLNAKLVELIAILHELHPADVAGLLESLPQKSARWCGIWPRPKKTAKCCWKCRTRCAKP